METYISAIMVTVLVIAVVLHIYLYRRKSGRFVKFIWPSVIVIFLALGTVKGAYMPHFQQWNIYSSSIGNFSVKLPSEPSIESSSEGVGEKPQGEIFNREGQFYILELWKADVQYFANYQTLSLLDIASPLDDRKSTIELFYDKKLDEAINSVRGTLIKEKEIKLGIHEGREVVFNGEPELTITQRMFLIDDQFYIVGASVPKKKSFLASLYPSYTQEYLDSFVIE